MHPTLIKIEKELQLEFEAAGHISHPGENGRAREMAVRSFLRKIVPPAYGVDTGFVIDAHGNVSNQVDIVIYRTQYHPVFEASGVKYFMIESVAAVIENKASIGSRDKLIQAFNNISSVKKLDRTGGGRNYFVLDFFSRAEDVDAFNPRHQVYGGIIAQSSLSENAFLDAWGELCGISDKNLWPNIYVDTDEFCLLWLKSEKGTTDQKNHPQEADSYALTAPKINGVPPMLDFANCLTNILRGFGVIDFDSNKYFPGSPGHKSATRRSIG